MADWAQRVVWSEGMFLRSQHFQQQDRHIEHLLRSVTGGLVSYPWGFRTLALNSSLLETGRLAIVEATGVLMDGTPFQIPQQTEPPQPLDLKDDGRTGMVYLAAPVSQPGAPEFDPEGPANSGVRYQGQSIAVRDSVAGQSAEAPIQVGRLRLRLMPGHADRTGYECLGVARVAQVNPNGLVELDRRYIPPCLHVHAAPALADRLTELQARIDDQAERLQEIVVRPREVGTSTVRNFILLQLLNRLQPVVAHHADLGLIHPEPLYAYLLGAAGELATFSLRQEERRPRAFPSYRHDDLTACFHPVFDAIMEGLGAPIVHTAVQIPLREHRRGVRTASITERELLDSARFYLAVRAAVSTEVLRRRFPEQAKLGPAYRLEELVRQEREGIPLELAPSAPREIPFHVDAMYFRLRSDNELYREFQRVGQLAIHIREEFPELALECWAIRGSDR